MKKSYFIQVILIVITIFMANTKNANSQRWKLRRYEVGAGIGTTQLFGDIGGTASESNWFGLKDIKFDETRLAFTTITRYKINTTFSIKSNLNFGFGRADDTDSRNDRGRSYNTKLFEFSGQFEHYFLPEDKRHRSAAMYNRRGMVNNYSTLAAYTFAGLGITYSITNHGPAEILPYDDYRSGGNIAPIILFGAGAKYILDDRSFINAEFGYRWALSDYVEGYTQIQASKHNDFYYFLLFSFNYRLKTTRRGLPAFIDRKYRKYGY